MKKLNFPMFNLPTKSKENKNFIFDSIRKKWFILTPEEWVRQHCVQYLINNKGYPIGLIQVEKKLKVNQREKRYDIVCFNQVGKINLLVECKRPDVKITQRTFDQISQYNYALKSDLIMITNGLEHYYCKINFEDKKYFFLDKLPPFKYH